MQQPTTPRIKYPNTLSHLLHLYCSHPHRIQRRHLCSRTRSIRGIDPKPEPIMVLLTSFLTASKLPKERRVARFPRDLLFCLVTADLDGPVDMVGTAASSKFAIATATKQTRAHGRRAPSPRLPHIATPLLATLDAVELVLDGFGPVGAQPERFMLLDDLAGRFLAGGVDVADDFLVDLLIASM